MKQYILNIVVPYVVEKRKELKLSTEQHALVIFDKFKAQCTTEILELVVKNNIDVVTVPANCTDHLQPLDASVNKAAKDFVSNQFQKWYSEQLQKQMRKGVKEPVHLRLSVMKPVAAEWFVKLHEYLLSKPNIIINGFKGAGITSDFLLN